MTRAREISLSDRIDAAIGGSVRRGWRGSRGGRSGLRIVALAASLACLAGCSVLNSAAGLGGGAAPGGQPAGGPAADRGTGVRVAAFAPAVVIRQRLVLPDGSVITVARFTGGIRLVLHCGPVDAGCPSVLPLKAGPAISQAEQPYLIAAFNGGFKAFSNAGGIVQEGYVLRPLVAGKASLVIDKSGNAAIGVWGPGFPADRSQASSVRQNLGPLVSDGKPTPEAANPSLWGGTLGGVVNVARSAIGQTASGQLIYVASMLASPLDLAQALSQLGARVGMQLDINPQWVQFDYALRAGAPLRIGLPGQARPVNQFLTGWTRDFFAVLATSLPVPPPAGTRLIPGG